MTDLATVLGSIMVIVVSAILLLILTFAQRKSSTKLRSISALTRLYRSIGLSVEDGTGLHVTIGHGGLLTARGGPALAGLAMLRYLAERTSVSDRPPIATTGDPALALLAQDTLQAGYQAAAAEEIYEPTTGRLTGMSPFSFAAGAMPILSDEHISANIMIGHFGPEAGLLTDAAERNHAPTIGASDDLAAQAVLFASTQEPLIGEELYAAGAYLGAGSTHSASLTVQDILRWVVIIALIVGAAAKLLGVI
jgi:hypothetical protein